ncbi:MAG TPA: L,D-transpeptidase [Nocardioides sp.]|nr:L,D-transpeptidase [Nocardioides sp.]
MKHAREPAGRHRHVQEPGRRRAVDPRGRHRGEVRPRYGRIALAGSAVVVTVVAILGSLGVLLPDSEPALAAASAGHDLADDAAPRSAAGASDDTTSADTDSDTSADTDRTATGIARTGKGQPRGTADAVSAIPPPADSGTGRRIVFSETQQRIWLVGADDEVLRTYLGSGSVYDNLDPGTYQVYSRSRYATGIDDSGTMEYFVRFTQGDEGAAIGFHSIPTLDGQPIQTRAQLGTPMSHGCIRQALPDAIALWNFAPIGTTVVVTA